MRTTLLRCLSVLASLSFFAAPTHAADKLVFGTNWYAQAEHGGFYQAIATGIYKKHSLDVEIKMGGPQVSGMQVLAGGLIDLWMGYDFQTLKAIEQGVPVTTVAAYFQKDPQVMLGHPDVKRFEDLKGKTLFVGAASDSSFWPWLKALYGYNDSQKRPYAFTVQPFLMDKNSAQQGYATSEPYAIEQAGVKPTILLLADAGYPPYATTVVAMQKTVDTRGDVIARFVKASAEGWVSYLKDPAPGNALIKRDNPKMTDAQIAYGINKMREFGLVDGGDAAKLGIGVMTDARWKATYDTMVKTGLLKAGVDHRKAYTLKYVTGLPLPAK